MQSITMAAGTTLDLCLEPASYLAGVAKLGGGRNDCEKIEIYFRMETKGSGWNKFSKVNFSLFG